MVEIQTIQFKRGSKAALTRYYVDQEHRLLDGEPVFEKDTGQLKIGNGVQNYADLPYVGNGSEPGGEDPRFVIHDPVENQVLLYDSALQKWVNKDLADSNSIIYLAAHGLAIKGYDYAKQGQMLVKDNLNGLAWIDPISTQELQQYVNQAATHATSAGNSAVQASNSANDADTSAGIAERINQKTVEWVNKKFWWGTQAEYNALTSINPNTFYFISSED